VCPESVDELAELAREKLAGSCDYDATEAALEVVAAALNLCVAWLGLTRVQVSWLALNVLRRANGYEGPIGILNAEDDLHPGRGSPEERAAHMAAAWRPWVVAQARARLAEHPQVVYTRHNSGDGETVELPNVSPTDHAHWKALAGGADDS
jgi:hypothetical protein